MSDWVYANTEMDAIAGLREQPGFVPVSRYAGIDALPDEVGAIGRRRFVVGDPAIQQRRNEIRTARWGKLQAAAAFCAECALMGHVRIAEKARCVYCGSLA